MMEVMVTTVAIGRAKLQTNTRHFTGRMPVPSPSVKALKGINAANNNYYYNNYYYLHSYHPIPSWYAGGKLA